MKTNFVLFIIASVLGGAIVHETVHAEEVLIQRAADFVEAYEVLTKASGRTIWMRTHVQLPSWQKDEGLNTIKRQADTEGQDGLFISRKAKTFLKTDVSWFASIGTAITARLYLTLLFKQWKTHCMRPVAS